MRLFFAAPLDAPARTRAAALIQRLAATGADYKWVEPENLHLTLAFLGETAEDRLPALKTALEAAARDKPAFTLVFDRLGAFDSLKRPRVIWLGAASGAEPLAQIAQGLAVIKEQDHPFAAHLTLGRQRGARNLSKLRNEVESFDNIRIESRIDRIELLRSHLSAQGPTYEVVSSRLL